MATGIGARLSWFLVFIVLNIQRGHGLTTPTPPGGTDIPPGVLGITIYEAIAELYVDGTTIQLPPNSDDWNVADFLDVEPNNRLVALRAVNSATRSCAGVLASVYGDVLLTNANFKCATTDYFGWNQLGFDDSSWPNAVEYGDNTDGHSTCAERQIIAGIEPNARWIWTNNPPQHTSIFCRGYTSFCQTSSPCVNGGTCQDNSPQICSCRPNYSGEFCETATCEGQCLNGGGCSIEGDAYVCTCRPGFTGVHCESAHIRSLNVTVKTTLYDLFIDGSRINLTYQNNWTVADAIILSPTNRLIALMAVDSTESCAGIIASVTDDFIVTDAGWSCNSVGDISWQNLGFNDTLWPPAYEMGLNDEVTSPAVCSDTMTNNPAVSPNAYWIWTDSIVQTPLYHQTIYCRAYIPICQYESPCRNGGTCNSNNVTLCGCLVGFIGQYCEIVDLKRLTLTAKEELYAAYVDGAPVEITNGSDWEKTDSLTIRSISRLVAVMAIQLSGNCPGILVSVDDDRGDYVVSNAQWRCSSSAPVGWSNLGFDDSSWAAATVYHQNDISNDTTCEHLGVISSISPDAYWIWTDTSVVQNVTAYCRGLLPICDVSPCKNGATCMENAINLCTCQPYYTGTHCDIEIPQTSAIFEDEDSLKAAPKRAPHEAETMNQRKL